MGEPTVPPAGARRKLLWLGGLGALLGLARGARTAVAADGDPLLAGRANRAASRTVIDATPGHDTVALRVVKTNGSIFAILALGGGGHISGLWHGPGSWASGGRNTSTGDGGHGAVGRGGDAAEGIAGAGVSVDGGETSSGTAGFGLRAQGGATGTGRAGAGLVATGGRSYRPTGPAGDGIHAEARTPGDPLDGRGAVAVYGEGGGQDGVKAHGIFGWTSSSANAGIVGVNVDAGPGVLGRSLAADGIAPGAGIAVRGSSGSAAAGRFESQSQAGVVGSSRSGRGLQGYSLHGRGVAAVSAASHGVSGTSTDGSGVGGFSTNGVGGHFEARSQDQYALRVSNTQAAGGEAGNGALGLLVNGNFVVENGTKSAAVKTSQGTRLLYCIESPISVFEDFGSARLAAGRARVDLDPLFAATIDTADYYVFLTPRSPATKGLAVVAQDARGFVVQEPGGGVGEYELDYRVVARRKGLPASHRLARFERPRLPATTSSQRPQTMPLPNDRPPSRRPAPRADD